MRQGGFVSTRGGLPAGRRIHLIYCLLTPWPHVHVKASKMSLTQTVTQMRIGAESTGQFLPGVFCIYVVWLLFEYSDAVFELSGC